MAITAICVRPIVLLEPHFPPTSHGIQAEATGRDVGLWNGIWVGHK